MLLKLKFYLWMVKTPPFIKLLQLILYVCDENSSLIEYVPVYPKVEPDQFRDGSNK